MELHGGFRFFLSKELAARNNLPEEFFIENMVVDEGKEAFLAAVTQNNDMGLTGTPNEFHLGLCSEVPAADHTLASITTEPGAAGGYARKVIERNTTGFPTIDTVSGKYRAVSKTVTFTATGAAFSVSFTRAFLCSVASGTTGTLFAYSGALTEAVLVADGDSVSVQYELFSH